MKKFKIDLLPEDFEENEFEDPWDCPLARAIQRHFYSDYVICGISSAYITYRNEKEGAFWNTR